MSRMYKISFTDLNSTVSFGGGGGGGGGGSKKSKSSGNSRPWGDPKLGNRRRGDGGNLTGYDSSPGSSRGGSKTTPRERCIAGATVGGAIAGGPTPSGVGRGAVGGFVGGVIGC